MEQDFLPDFLALPSQYGHESEPAITPSPSEPVDKAKALLDKHWGGANPEELACLRNIHPQFYDDPLVLNVEYQRLCDQESFLSTHLKPLLVLHEENGGFDDLIIATKEFITRKHAKRLMPLLNRELSQNEVEEVVREIFGTNGDKVINKVMAPGGDHDDAYEFFHEDAHGNEHRYRYRINVSSFQDKRGRKGLAVTVRRLTTTPKTLEELGVSQYIIDNCTPRTGLVLVGGETGSGKSTLCAGIAAKIRMDSEPRIMLTYESPIEYILTSLPGPNPILQHSVGEFGDFKSFYDALRNALRRTPEVIYLGESRDKETFMTLPKIPQSGHMGLTTVHADRIVTTFSRIANEIGGEGDHVIRTLVQSVHLVVVQYLAKTEKSVVPVQEVLLFTPKVRAEILAEKEDILSAIGAAVKKHGQPMEKHAEELMNKGQINMETFDFICQSEVGGM